jgi:hypothetical protein
MVMKLALSFVSNGVMCMIRMLLIQIELPVFSNHYEFIIFQQPPIMNLSHLAIYDHNFGSTRLKIKSSSLGTQISLSECHGFNTPAAC